VLLYVILISVVNSIREYDKIKLNCSQLIIEKCLKDMFWEDNFNSNHTAVKLED
jgi:hypothetical protein